jgi:hypothetical protein
LPLKGLTFVISTSAVLCGIRACRSWRIRPRAKPKYDDALTRGASLRSRR